MTIIGFEHMLFCGNFFFCKIIDFAQTKGKKTLKLEVNIHTFFTNLYIFFERTLNFLPPKSGRRRWPAAEGLTSEGNSEHDWRVCHKSTIHLFSFEDKKYSLTVSSTTLHQCNNGPAGASNYASFLRSVQQSTYCEGHSRLVRKHHGINVTNIGIRLPQLKGITYQCFPAYYSA